MEPKYPDIHAPHTGENGNIFNLLAIVTRAMDRAGVSTAELRDALTDAVLSSDGYDEALAVLMSWVAVS